MDKSFQATRVIQSDSADVARLESFLMDMESNIRPYADHPVFGPWREDIVAVLSVHGWKIRHGKWVRDGVVS